MSELTDLEICKRIAEIEGINFTTCIKKSTYPHREAVYHRLYEGTRPATMYSKAIREYNPLTDDALCFQLMVKHSVELSPMFSGCWCATLAKVYAFDEQIDHRLCHSSNVYTIPVYTFDDSPNKAICLAIIKAHKVKS